MCLCSVELGLRGKEWVGGGVGGPSGFPEGRRVNATEGYPYIGTLLQRRSAEVLPTVISIFSCFEINRAVNRYKLYSGYTEDIHSFIHSFIVHVHHPPLLARSKRFVNSVDAAHLSISLALRTGSG